MIQGVVSITRNTNEIDFFFPHLGLSHLWALVSGKKMKWGHRPFIELKIGKGNAIVHVHDRSFKTSSWPAQ
jgi:hypothetical protein